MKKKLKKLTLITASAATVIAASSLAYADIPPAHANSSNDNNNSLGIVIAIQELGNKIEGLTKAGVRSVNDLAYTLDQSFWPSMQLNAKQADIQDRVRAQTHEASDRAIKQSLQPFSTSTLTYTSKSQPEVKLANAQSTNQQNAINSLKNLEASDTIYSLMQGAEFSRFVTGKNISRPVVNDDAFNFAALVESVSYTPEQIKNSEHFIGYATKQYQSYTDGLNLSELKSALTQYQSQGVKALAQKIDEFRKNTAYQNYQLMVRSMTANKSAATDILTGIANERKPIMTTQADSQLESISRAVGVEPQVVSVKTPDGQSVSMYRYASPLQIAQYRANYRLSDTKWYQEVAGDSAENLQRKSVILLAEISQQLHQNHLDNEKIMGIMAIMSQQTADVSAFMMKTQVTEVNTAIKNFAGDASDNSATPKPTNINNPPANPNDYSNVDPNDPNTYPKNVDPKNPNTYPQGTIPPSTNSAG